MRYLEITCTITRGQQYVIVESPEVYEYYKCPTQGKTAALIYGISKIDLDDYDVIVLVDDDVKATRLDNFVQRFYDPTLGVLCGNREFTNTSTIASAARHLWGVHARPIMELARIPCGALMGIRVQLIPEFLELWATTVFDDTAAAKIAKARGYTFRYDRNYRKTIDASTISLVEFWRFVVRQYADVRSIGPWKSLLCAWALALIVSALPYLIMGPSAFLLYPLGLFVPGTRRNWRVMLALPLAHASFIIGVPYAAMVKKIKWKHRTVDLKTGAFV